MSTIESYLDELARWLSSIEKWAEAKEVSAHRSLSERIEDMNAFLAKMKQQSPSNDDLVKLQAMAISLEGALQDVKQIDEYVPAGKHALPPLPYAYEALEPVISREIMKLHHTVHHQAYVDGLNKAEMKMKEAREQNNFDLLKHWEREAAFHGSGHYLHTIFWYNMKPDGGGEPEGELRELIERDFGSFPMFKKQFSEAAKKVEGVGWALLVWSARAHRLEILQSERHMILTQWDTIPLLVIDVWEHAYYLQYKTERGKYVDNWWGVIDWPDVNGRFRKARELEWTVYRK
ncbi:superoxide dismutase [Pradoshia sp.]